MTSLSELSVVRMPAPEDAAVEATPRTTWSQVDPQRGRRPSPVTLVVLALLAGIGAMVLGALAVLSAARAEAPAAATATVPASSIPAVAGVERRVLALLAKPSTERVVFRGSGGRLVLAVGSGGRAAILVRGDGRWSAGTSSVWVLRSGKAVRAARLGASDRAIFLPVPLRRGDGVAIAADRRSALRQGPSALTAARS